MKPIIGISVAMLTALTLLFVGIGDSGRLQPPIAAIQVDDEILFARQNGELCFFGSIDCSLVRKLKVALPEKSSELRGLAYLDKSLFIWGQDLNVCKVNMVTGEIGQKYTKFGNGAFAVGVDAARKHIAATSLVNEVAIIELETGKTKVAARHSGGMATKIHFEGPSLYVCDAYGISKYAVADLSFLARFRTAEFGESDSEKTGLHSRATVGYVFDGEKIFTCGRDGMVFDRLFVAGDKASRLVFSSGTPFAQLESLGPQRLLLRATNGKLTQLSVKDGKTSSVRDRSASPVVVSVPQQVFHYLDENGVCRRVHCDNKSKQE